MTALPLIGEPAAEGTKKELGAEQLPVSAQPMRPSLEPDWLWRGTRRSVDRGSISILALVETLFATALAAYIALRYGTLHLVVSTCIAPLLLLRTPASQDLGLKWGRWAIKWIFEKLGTILSFKLFPSGREQRWFVDLLLIFRGIAFLFVFIGAIVPLVFAVVTLMTLGVRSSATFVTFCRSPFQCLKAIPGNWWRSIACVDATHVPELLPGIDRAISSPEFRGHVAYKYLHPWKGLRHLLEPSSNEPALMRWLPAAQFTLLIALPAWLYRWSLKGTFLLYSPLVWVAHRSFKDSPWERLRDIREIAFHRLVRGYSVLVFVMLLSRMAMDILFPSWRSLWIGLPFAAQFDAVLGSHMGVAPHVPPLWQIAMGANAILAWVIYFYADWVLTRHARRSLPNEHSVDGVLRTVWFLRTSLSVYVILSGIYAAAVLTGMSLM